MATTKNKSIEKPANGADVDTWDVNVNADWDIIDASLGDVTSINVVAAAGTIALTAAQYRPPMIVLSGLLSANVNYQFPATIGGLWTIRNSTTGAFTVTFSSAGAGTSVVVTQGARANVLCDATNVVVYGAAAGANSDITSLLGLGITGIVKGTGASAALVAATAGTDYAKPDTASTWTAKQSLTGSTSVAALALTNALENGTVSATATTGTIAYYLSSQSVLYFTSNAAANWTLNITFASTPTTLDSVMATGQIVTLAFLVTQGATPYYNTTVQVDGTAVGVTTKWQGGAPTGGNASGVDVYTMTVVKTAAATFSVFASITPFN